MHDRVADYKVSCITIKLISTPWLTHPLLLSASMALPPVTTENQTLNENTRIMERPPAPAPTEAEIVTANVFRYLQQIHDIYLPQQLLEFSFDAQLHQAYGDAINQVVQTQRQANVVVVGRGAVLYALLARQAGARQVCIVEQWPTLASVYRDIVSANGLADQITVYQQPFRAFNWLPEYGEAPNLLITDAVGGALLDGGMLSLIKHARAHILAPDHCLIPCSAQLYATALQVRTGEINGFDLSEFNRYRWSPCYQGVHLGEEPYQQLSVVEPILDFDFYQSIEDQTLEKPLTIIEGGILNAVGLWYDLQLAEGLTLSTAPHQSSQQRQQALLYLDKEGYFESPSPGNTGAVLTLKVSCKSDRLYLAVTAPEPMRPADNRLSPSVAAWHFPMIADQERNNAYQRSIEQAVARHPQAEVLDIGAGTGLLAMMAKRAGAVRVSACEMVPHIADMAEDVLRKNGYDHQIQLISKWSKDLEIPGDLPRKANILVSETVDHSMLGESFLATFKHARQHLLIENPTVIPAAATVYAAAIELRVDNILGWDLSLLNRFRAGHYSSFHLDKTDFRQLSDTVTTFHFDFYQQHFTPRTQTFDFPIHTAGMVNAIAFWFHLHLDDTITLDTGPDSSVTAWQQAVIFCDNEFPVQSEPRLPVIASHDLHRLTFQVDDLECVMRGIKVRYPDASPWFERFTGTEKLIPKNTEKIKELLKGLSRRQLRSLLDELAEHYPSAGFETGLIADFIQQLNQD